MVLTSLLSQSFALSTEIKERLIATAAISTEMERIKNMPFDSIGNLGPEFYPCQEGTDALNNCQGNISVQDYGAQDIKKIMLNLEWDSSHGRRLSRKIIALISRK